MFSQGGLLRWLEVARNVATIVAAMIATAGVLWASIEYCTRQREQTSAVEANTKALRDLTVTMDETLNVFNEKIHILDKRVSLIEARR